MDLKIYEVDFDDESHRESLIEIIDAYAREPGGQNAPLSGRARRELAHGLAEHP